MEENEIIAVQALPCLCRGNCQNGNVNKKRCPCFIARMSKKKVIMCYCRICKKITWHIGFDCVQCRLRAMGYK